MRIEVKRPQDLTPGQVETWARLQDEGGFASPFLTPSWLHALEAADGPDHGGLKVAVIGDPDVPQGYFAARVRRDVASPPGAPLCDYQAVVASPSLTFSPSALLGALGAGRLDFDKLLPGRGCLGPYVQGEAPAFVIDLRDGFEAYAAARRAAGSDVLRDIAKKRRKLERENGPVAFVVDDTDALGALVQWKRSQYVSTGQPDIFTAGWPERLLRLLLASSDPRCRARLFTLRCGEEILAAHLALVGRTMLHAWFIAHGEAGAAYSPGLILLGEVVRWAAAQGLREVDLGPGDYRFKRSFATDVRPVAHGFVGRPSAASLARAAAYGVRAAAEALPLGPVSALPGKAMRRLDVVRSLG